ncbi:hypothetical protein BY458DRAFT_506552, partial [Sporodiniella umbellata]
MTDSLQFYQQETADPMYSTLFLNTFQERVGKKLSFSGLLRTPSVIGRKLSLLCPKKPELTLMIPNTLLRRKGTDSTDSSSEEELKTPISDRFSEQQPVFELETAITTPDANTLDHSGQAYSNFYIKLPNGNWMVRVRDRNRKIIGTYEIDGAM